MKVAILCDKPGSAIYRLALPIQKYNPHLDITVCSLHPKRPDPEQVSEACKAVEGADILLVSYWKSYDKLKEFLDEKRMPQHRILWHHNPYDIGLKAWGTEYESVVCHNSTIHNQIPYAHFIPQGIDLDFFEFNEDRAENNTVLMVAARIEGKKGIVPVAQACHELGYHFILVGRISDQGCFDEILRVCPDVEFRENVTEEKLKQSYYDAQILVCNSQDDFESGPLPVLEAMACGTVVVTRNVGQIPDLYDGSNMVLRPGSVDDVEEIKKALKETIENPPFYKKVQQKQWDTVKNRSEIKMAWQFERLFYNTTLGFLDQPWVSVITPIYDHPEDIAENLTCSAIQDYPYFEIVIVDSSRLGIDIDKNRQLILEVFKKAKLGKEPPPIKYVRMEYQEGVYTLPNARNQGVIAASGDLLVFCDERICMEPNAVSEFVRHWEPYHWMWGIKDDSVKGFVENFSAVNRKEFVFSGMFNTSTCERYGCLTQEVRTRFEARPFSPVLFKQVGSARAKSNRKTHGKCKRRKDIIKSKLTIWKLYSSMMLE
jgi:hypothetical protein